MSDHVATGTATPSSCNDGFMCAVENKACSNSQELTRSHIRDDALCLYPLLTIDHALVFESKKFQVEQLAQFGVNHSDIAAYVDELEQSFHEWHHGCQR